MSVVSHTTYHLKDVSESDRLNVIFCKYLITSYSKDSISTKNINILYYINKYKP